MNWFKLTAGGNETIRLIQQQLNEDWSNVIGVGPCDGVVSRYTAFALIGALQAAEGVTTELITNINSVNFGNATTASFENFPGTLNRNNNFSEYVPFNKLVQYGLYFNGYDPGRFDGIYDSNVENQVIRFQEFYALTSGDLITLGEVNVSTMKSLLTSKGDTSRSARACDCATVLNQQQAFDLKAAGYTHVGRYLTGSLWYLTPMVLDMLLIFFKFGHEKSPFLNNVRGGSTPCCRPLIAYQQRRAGLSTAGVARSS